jgi:hypothetical protein
VLAIVGCKYKNGPSGRRSVQDLAQVGDWVIGTGGQSSESCGNGNLLYAMKVTGAMIFDDYWNSDILAAKRAIRRGHVDRWPHPWYNENVRVLLSNEFAYFGNARFRLIRNF